MRIRRADRNQPEIVEALRKAGAFVEMIHTIGRGCPDLLVRMRGVWHVIEVKDEDQPPSKRALTDDEAKWHALAGPGAVAIVESPLQALEAIKP